MDTTVIQLIPHPVSQGHSAGEGPKMEGSGVLNSLSHLVKMVIGTHPVKDPHTEEVDQDQIVDL